MISALPTEILHQIFRELPRSHLKQLRMVDHHVNATMENILFETVFLRRNADSFENFTKICSRPGLARLIKKIVYQCKTIIPAGVFENLDLVYRNVDAVTRRLLCEKIADSLDWHNPDFCSFCDTNLGTRQFHGLEVREVADAFKSLSCLQGIEFEAQFPCMEHWLALLREGSRVQLSASQWASLGIKVSDWSNRDHIRQFTGLMSAAYFNDRKLELIKTIKLPINTFDQTAKTLDMINWVTGCCQDLDVALSIREVANISYYMKDLSEFLLNASSLRSLKVSLGNIRFPTKASSVMLSDVLPPSTHFSALQALELQGFCVVEDDLETLIANHMYTLRSLKLRNMNLFGRSRSSMRRKFGEASWVPIIHFLQSAMALREMKFAGILSNELGQAWQIYDDEEASKAGCTWPYHECCFKHRVERFVVEGGQSVENNPKQKTSFAALAGNFDESWMGS